MTDRVKKALAQLDHDGAQTLALAGLYARTLESLALRIQSVVAAGPTADTTALRSAGFRLSHTATEAIAALASLIVQGARLEALATMRPSLDASDEDPTDR